MLKAKAAPEEEEIAEVVEEKSDEPRYGTREWIQYCSTQEGLLPTPIDVSITGSTLYICPELKWYNFDVYPHKVKMTNTGYTVHIGAKWRTERPYLEGGPFLGKHVLSQIHFHWGSNMMEGSDHTVDKRSHPGEMQVTFFRSEYLSQQEAIKHPDGVVMFCFLIKYGVNDDKRLSWVIEGFPRIQEAQTCTRIGPYPMSHLIPMFFEDYFLYWGKLESSTGEENVIRWLVSRSNLFASYNQMKQFRKLWDPWDEPLLRNYRPLQERGDRHIFFISPHWCQYNSLLPIPRVPEESISELSPAYKANIWMLPPQNADMIPDLLETTFDAEQISRLKTSQSPLVITLNRCLTCSTLDPLQYKGYWNRDAYGNLVNKGTTAHFTFEPQVRPTVLGGPLVAEYIFEELIFHWSLDKISGCEHIIDGQGYASECHFIHYNSEYESMEDAIDHFDGLAVVGFFLQAVDKPNPKFDPLVEGFKAIKKSGQSTKVTPESLSWMMSDELQEGNYITYRGSLTTPPYPECVTWIIYENPITIGTEQLTFLRELEGPNNFPIKRNVRPTQKPPLGHTVVYVSQMK